MITIWPQYLNKELSSLSGKTSQDSIARINEIDDISDIVPMTHALDDFECTFREDVKEESISKEEIFANCGDSDGDAIVVPRMVG